MREIKCELLLRGHMANKESFNNLLGSVCDFALEE